MEKIINRVSVSMFAVLLVIGFVFLSVSKTSTVYGSAPSGLASSVATSSQAAVSTTAISLFATSTSCASRIITTYASPVMLTFSDYAGQTPTGMFGHLQAASTTIAYDSGLYGCGLVKAYSFTSQTITVTETR